jgi:hypothetical protein
VWFRLTSSPTLSFVGGGGVRSNQFRGVAMAPTTCLPSAPRLPFRQRQLLEGGNSTAAAEALEGAASVPLRLVL